MPRRSRRSGFSRPVQQNLAVRHTPRRISLPNPEVSRQPDESIRIDSKSFSCVFDAEPYTYGYRLQMREDRGRDSHFNEHQVLAETKFAQTGEQVRQFGSFVQQRKTEFKTMPGMGNFPDMLNALKKVDQELNALSAELGQLRSLTSGVLPRKKHIQGSGDHFAFQKLVEKAENMNMKH
ncbi:MAG: hypothetical protein Q9169_007315 [Polycauliona sp. 2 TL-2023]